MKDFPFIDQNFKKVNRYTRAGFAGKKIYCPHCLQVATVFHFCWIAIDCENCKNMVDKYDWFFDTKDPKNTKRGHPKRNDY